jgi:hypothetical protein
MKTRKQNSVKEETTIVTWKWCLLVWNCCKFIPAYIEHITGESNQSLRFVGNFWRVCTKINLPTFSQHTSLNVCVVQWTSCLYVPLSNTPSRKIIRFTSFTWLQASPTMLMRTVPFWGITQRRVVIIYRRFGTTHRSPIQGSRSTRRVGRLDPWRWERYVVPQRR